MPVHAERGREFVPAWIHRVGAVCAAIVLVLGLRAWGTVGMAEGIGQHRPIGGVATWTDSTQVLRILVQSFGSKLTSDISLRIEPLQSPSCPSGMVLVEGNYCPKWDHRCIDWMDEPSLPYARCRRYAPPAICKEEKVFMRFCIDRTEFVTDGEVLPSNYLSLRRAAALCRTRNERLCSEQEWNFACEGEDGRPYPYGWEREPKCNQDRSDLFEMRGGKQVLKDHRAAASDFAECVSPFGVVNLVGNVDEPVLWEGRHFPPMRTALKGGWWMAGRNRCRPATTAHDDDYNDIQIGARCCSDAKRGIAGR